MGATPLPEDRGMRVGEEPEIGGNPFAQGWGGVRMGPSICTLHCSAPVSLALAGFGLFPGAITSMPVTWLVCLFPGCGLKPHIYLSFLSTCGSERCCATTVKRVAASHWASWNNRQAQSL